MSDQALSLTLFSLFVLVTLGITVWAARKTHTTDQFYAAGRSVKRDIGDATRGAGRG